MPALTSDDELPSAEYITTWIHNIIESPAAGPQPEEDFKDDDDFNVLASTVSSSHIDSLDSDIGPPILPPFCGFGDDLNISGTSTPPPLERHPYSDLPGFPSDPSSPDPSSYMCSAASSGILNDASSYDDPIGLVRTVSCETPSPQIGLEDFRMMSLDPYAVSTFNTAFIYRSSAQGSGSCTARASQLHPTATRRASSIYQRASPSKASMALEGGPRLVETAGHNFIHHSPSGRYSGFHIKDKEPFVMRTSKSQVLFASTSLSEERNAPRNGPLVPSPDDLLIGGSVGSLYHHNGTCRPCVFHNNIKKGGCQNGAACEFCHYPHVPRKKPPRPSKRHRQHQIAIKKKMESENSRRDSQ